MGADYSGLKVVKDFGGMVRRLRLEQGYSQEGFAFQVGLPRTYVVGSIERGEKAVTIVTTKLARALGTTLAGLFAQLERGWYDSSSG